MEKTKTFILSICLVGMLAQCTPQEKTESTEQTTTVMANTSEKPTFVHTVFFWLKDGVTEEQKQAFEKGMEKLGTVSTIQSYMYGTPAGTPREVVDNSYDYAWIVHFANIADQDAYQDDPIHHEFIENHEEIWERVQVYDTILK